MKSPWSTVGKPPSEVTKHSGIAKQSVVLIQTHHDVDKNDEENSGRSVPRIASHVSVED